MTIFQIHLSTGIIILLLFGAFSILYMLGFYVYRKIRPYDYEEESALLQEFLYDGEAIKSGFDTSSMGDFERWKAVRKTPISSKESK